jgi:hypothetical protein
MVLGEFRVEPLEGVEILTLIGLVQGLAEIEVV